MNNTENSRSQRQRHITIVELERTSSQGDNDNDSNSNSDINNISTSVNANTNIRDEAPEAPGIREPKRAFPEEQDEIDEENPNAIAVSSVDYEAPMSVNPIPASPILAEKHKSNNLSSSNNEPYKDSSDSSDNEMKSENTGVRNQDKGQNERERDNGNTSQASPQNQEIAIEAGGCLGCCSCLTMSCCCCKQSCDCCSSTCTCCRESCLCCKEVCISCCECNKECIAGTCVLCERCLMCCGETSWDVARKTSDTCAFSCMCFPTIIVNSFACLIEGIKGGCSCLGEFLGHSGTCIKGSASEAFGCCVKSSRACCPTCCSCGAGIISVNADVKVDAGKDE
jgi:hypothetical protein